MKQLTAMIKLRDLMDADEGFGREEGTQLFGRLREEVDGLRGDEVIHLSLEGVRRTDSSFPRVSVLTLAKILRTKRGFCVVNFENQNILDNWDVAAKVEEFPLIIWKGSTARILGPQPSTAVKDVFEIVQSRSGTLASEVARKFDLTISNASNRLKKLYEEGYVWRNVRSADGGGIEHVYVPMK